LQKSFFCVHECFFLSAKKGENKIYPKVDFPKKVSEKWLKSKFPTLIAIQLVGDEIVEKRCSYSQYREYQKRERELCYEGWHVITIVREFLDWDLDEFRQYMSKTIELAQPRDPLYVVT
jgi:hypothetical protein